MLRTAFLILLLNAQIWLGAHPLIDRDPYQVRELIDQRMMSIEAETVEVNSVQELSIDANGIETPLRIYRSSSEENLPLILLIHGGAWIGGNLETHDNLARYLCKNSHAIVVSVGYLNSPEGKFPLALEQCYAALKWAQTLETNGKVAVVGDSAGGNMAAVVCMIARDRAGPKVDLQVLINPATDLTCKDRPKGASYCWMASMYLNDLKEAFHPYASPVLATNLTNLPPALVLTAELDEIRADGEIYAQKLRDAGNFVNVYCQKNIGHLSGDGARASRRAYESLNIAVATLQAYLR